MHVLTDMFSELSSMNSRRMMMQAVNTSLVICTALMTWKSLMVATNSESPVVVVLSGSMEPAYYRGDILVLELWEQRPIESGDVVVYKLGDRDIPIVHRIIDVHDGPAGTYYLTKGDNNTVNDRGLYPSG